MTYLDHAATSNPKAPGVADAVQRALVELSANPGRGGHRLSVAAGRAVFDVRADLARLFDAPDESRFIFTLNATDALNMVLHGLLRPGGRVLVSSLEHNAVWRPVHDLAQQGVRLEVIPPGPAGWRREPFDLARFEAELQKGADLVAVTHASNVTGQVLPVERILDLAHAYGVPLLLDASQTAGHLPLHLRRLPVDFLACSAHKGLLGPQGVGILYVAPGRDFHPSRQGGTGGNSERVEPPDELPERFEAGTLNTPGILGLGAAVRWLLERGVEAAARQPAELHEYLLEELHRIPGVETFAGEGRRIPLVSLRVEGWTPAELEAALDEEYGCLARAGLHCAPEAHRTIGTFPEGTLRVSLGPFTAPEAVDTFLHALGRLVRIRRREGISK